MKALEIRRNVAKLGLARIAAAVSPSAAVRVGPLEYRHVDEPDLPGTRLASRQHPPVRHLRFGPVADRRTRVDVLRRLGELPVRARPRDRRLARRRDASDHRAGPRSRSARLRSPVRRRGARRRRRLRPPRHRRPRTRHPDRVLLLDGRRLGAAVRRPREPAASHRRRHARRAGGARRADRRRDPRRAAHVADHRRGRPRRSSPCSVQGRWGSPRSPDCAATCPTCASSSALATPSRRATATSFGADIVVDAGRAGPRRAADGRLSHHRRPPHERCPCHDRRRRQRGVDHRLPAHHPAARPRRAAGDAVRGDARSHRALAPRDRDQGRLHVRHRDAAGRDDGAHVRPRRRHRQRVRVPSDCCRRRTGSPTTSTPSPTPRRRAAGARSRSPSICERRAEHASPRIRPRGRPLDPTDPVLARRGIQPREAAGRPQPGRSTRPSRWPRSTTSTARSGGRCSSRTTPIPCRRCCSPG